MFDNLLISYFLYIFIFLCILIYKFFLKKGGIILKIDGILPRRIGIRKEDSKWASLVSTIGVIAILICFLDLFVRFIHQEADKIQQQIGNL